jgi:hypothetical protein
VETAQATFAGAPPGKGVQEVTWSRGRPFWSARRSGVEEVQEVEEVEEVQEVEEVEEVEVEVFFWRSNASFSRFSFPSFLLSTYPSLFSLGFLPKRPSPRQTTGPSSGVERGTEARKRLWEEEKKRWRSSDEGREREQDERELELELLGRRSGEPGPRRCCCGEQRGSAAAGAAADSTAREAAIFSIRRRRRRERGREEREWVEGEKSAFVSRERESKFSFVFFLSLPNQEERGDCLVFLFEKKSSSLFFSLLAVPLPALLFRH